jgi:CubicO group peptidase (beta-lactamase class C family)
MMRMTSLQSRVSTKLVQIICCGLCFSLLTTTAAAQTKPAAPATLSADKSAAIEAAALSVKSRMNIPAMSVAVAQDDEIRFERAYGTADLQNSVPATPATVFRIASTTKSLTAVAVMQLVEKGKLDLDAPVQKYVPSFPTKTFPITTRLLLAHLSGIRNYRRDEPERTNRYETLTEALSIFKDDPLEFEPGTKFSYTTYGYTLVGAVIESVSGMSYIDYMRENIFKPAGMQHTQADDVFAIIPNRAAGYHPKVYGVFDGNVRNADLMDSSYKLSAGGLVSTADDLARFAIALQDGVLIKSDTFQQMCTTQKTRDGRETGYGLGWYVQTGDRATSDSPIWLGGVQPGFTSVLRIWPSKHTAVVILTNLEGGGRLGLGTLADQIAEILRH